MSNADDAAIVKAIVAMAHSLDLSITAEGIETKEQLDFLQGQRCDEMQGYYFSPPVPADKLEALLKKDNSKKRAWCRSFNVSYPPRLFEQM